MESCSGDLVFVYGTLKKGHYNHGVLGQSVYQGKAYIPTYVMHDIHGAFPGVCQRKIHGELYRIDTDDTAYRLDMLEGYPDMYDRAKMEVVTKDTHDTVWAWVYLYQYDDAGNIIIDGKWR